MVALQKTENEKKSKDWEAIFSIYISDEGSVTKKCI